MGTIKISSLVRSKLIWAVILLLTLSKVYGIFFYQTDRSVNGKEESKDSSSLILKMQPQRDSLLSELISTNIHESSEITWTITKELVVGKVSLSQNNLLRTIKQEYSSRPIYLLKPVADRFEQMCAAADRQGIKLIAISGMRTFQQQKNIWERKWNSYPLGLSDSTKATNILLYSSMPMTSRHHWGTDVDINNLENSYFDTEEGQQVYKWLVQNAPNYGFWQVYTDKKYGRKGYEMEKWHWSYMPISSEYLKHYNRHVSYNDIRGFIGAEVAQKLNIIENYVNGIDNSNTFSQLQRE